MLMKKLGGFMTRGDKKQMGRSSMGNRDPIGENEFKKSLTKAGILHVGRCDGKSTGRSGSKYTSVWFSPRLLVNESKLCLVQSGKTICTEREI